MHRNGERVGKDCDELCSSSRVLAMSQSVKGSHGLNGEMPWHDLNTRRNVVLGANACQARRGCGLEYTKQSFERSGSYEGWRVGAGQERNRIITFGLMRACMKVSTTDVNTMF